MNVSRMSRFVSLLLVAGMALVILPARPAAAAPGLTAGTLAFNTAWQSSLYSEQCADSPPPLAGAPCKTYQLSFTDPLPTALQVGQILTSASSPKLPHGLMVKVTSLTDNGSRTTVQAQGVSPTAAYTGTVATDTALSGGSGTFTPAAPGITLVPSGQVPSSVKKQLAAPQAAAASGTCPTTTVGGGGGMYFELSDWNIPLGKGFAVNVTGWFFYKATMHFAMYQPGDANHPGIQAEVDETNYTDASLYLTPTVLTSNGGNILGVSKSVPLGEWVLGVIDIQLGPLPVVLVPTLKFTFNLEGQLLAGLGLDIQGGDEGQTTTFLMHNDGSVTATSTPGALKECGDLNGDSAGFTPTAGVKANVSLGAEITVKLYDVVGVAVGLYGFIEDWLTATANTGDPSCSWPAFENDLFLGAEIGISLTVLATDYRLASFSPWGLTAMGTFTIDPCSSAPPVNVPPPGGNPSGWVVGHAAHAGDDYPYEGLGLYEHHDGTDPWNEWYGQCDSFAAWKVYENTAGSATQHPPFRPDQGWTPTNANVSPVIGFASGNPPNNWGDAKDWGPAAKRAGFSVTNAPAPGSIAWWAATPDMPVGHVGYVTDVYSNGTIRIEQYNLRLNGEYSTIVMGLGGADDSSFGAAPWHLSWPTGGFIHIHDGSAGAPVPDPQPGGYPANVLGPGSATGFTLTGSAYPNSDHGWYTRAGHGLIGKELWTNTNGGTVDSTATWNPALTAGACYALSVFIPDNYANGTGTYTVHAADGAHAIPVNQETYTNAYAPLGNFKADSGGHLSTTLTDQAPTGFYLAADAMMFAPATTCQTGANSGIIDPASPASQFSLAGSAYPGSVHGWYSSAGHGLLGHQMWTNTNGSTPDSTATWTAALTAGACYTVSAFIPDNHANAEATYTVFDSVGPESRFINQQSYTNTWASLGVFRVPSYATLVVQVSDVGTTGYYVAADAMMYTPSSCAGTGGGTSSAYPAGVYGPGSPQFSSANWWATSSGHGLIGREMWTHTNGSTVDSRALWTPYLVPGACYAVSAYVPDTYANTPSAQYTVFGADGGHTVSINQEAYTNAYVPLGTYQTEGDGTLDVLLTDVGPAGYYVAADAMKYQQAPCTAVSVPSNGYPGGVFGPGSPEFSTTDVWYTDPGHGLNGRMLWTHTNGSTAASTATWTPTLQANACYTVAVYVPDNYSDTVATYYLWSNTTNPARPRTFQVNDASYTNTWVTLGNAVTFSDGSITLELTDIGTTGHYVAADAVRFTAC